MSDSQKKLAYIDSLRGLAMLLVLIVHTSQMGSHLLPSVIQNVLNQGARGVQLFFVASAFTLFYSFRSRESEPLATSNFFIRRFFRIAPMYYLGIAYYLWQNGLGDRYWLGDQDHITISNIVSNLTFTHGLYPYWITSLVPGGWSITVEMMFYCCVPLLYRYVRTLDRAIVLLGILIVLRIVLYAILSPHPLVSDKVIWEMYLFFYFPNQMPAFIFGIIAYLILIEDKRIQNSRSYLILSAGLVIELLYGNQLPENLVLAGLIFLLLLMGLSAYPVRLLVNPLTRYLGKISYSGYLVHFAIIYWLEKFNFMSPFPTGRQLFQIANFGVNLVIVLLLTTLISTFFYHMVEVPFQSMGRLLIARRKAKAFA